MLDFSNLDIRLLFPNITEAWALAIEGLVAMLELVSIILMIIGEWKLFKKFGEKPWKSLVPCYNSYLLYKYAWSKNIFWIYFGTTTVFDIAQSAAKYLSQNQPDNVWMTFLVLVSLPFGIVSAVCSILYAARLAESFGKGKLFALGLLLLYPVFIMILGAGRIQYIGNCKEDCVSDEAGNPEIEGEVL